MIAKFVLYNILANKNVRKVNNKKAYLEVTKRFAVKSKYNTVNM